MAALPIDIAQPKRTRGDKVRVALVVIGVTVALSSLVFGSGGTFIANKSIDQLKTYQHNAHHHTSAQNKRIQGLEQQILAKDTAIRTAQMQNKGTLKEVAQLQQDLTAGVPAIVSGQNALVAALGWIECSLSNGAHSCGPAPSI